MPGRLIPQLGEVFLPRNGDGDFSCINPVPKPSDQLNTKDWGLWLTPRKEDLVNGSQHINTRVESSTSTGLCWYCFQRGC